MELQQLLLGRDYLQRAGPRTAGYLASSDLARASVDTADVVRSADRSRSSSVVAGLAVDCHRSSLHDVLLLRRHQQHQHPVSAVMQYPPSQHLPAAAAAAIGLASAGSSPYYSPYYQRSSSSSQHYLPTSHCFPDSSRHNLDSFAASMQPGFSYEQHAALLRDSAVTRLAVGDGAGQTPTRNDASSRLGVELTSYCADRRCTAGPLHDCLPVAGPLNLPSSRHYMSAGRHLSSGTSTTSHTGAVGGAFMRYLRPPVSTQNFIGDCVCQWVDPASIKFEVSIYADILLVSDQVKRDI